MHDKGSNEGLLIGLCGLHTGSIAVEQQTPAAGFYTLKRSAQQPLQMPKPARLSSAYLAADTDLPCIAASLACAAAASLQAAVAPAAAAAAAAQI